ncbi:MAG: hypothetical protein WAO52_05565 [Prolixibacteraceae bacterium]
MDKLDKQFGEMMKGIKIESPSADFTLKVMHRIQAEAAVQKQPILATYTPVISKKAWIIIFAVFLLLFVYILVSGKPAGSASDTGVWSTVSDSLKKLNTGQVSSVLSKGKGMFSSIPAITYLILMTALFLWTLDSFISKFRHQLSESE